MVRIKEKTKYQPSGFEVGAAWVTTAAAGLAFAWFLYRAWFGS